MTQVIEQEIAVTGSLMSITLFEERLMKNFLLISNKLRRLEGLFDFQQKQKALEKQLKFLSMKVQTLVQKMPKDSGSVSRNDAKLIAKDMVFEVLNSNDERLAKTKYHNDFIEEIQKMKAANMPSTNGAKDQNNFPRKQGNKASFTAGQVLRDNQRQKNKSPKSNLPIQSLKDVLDEKELKIVHDIHERKQEKEQKNTVFLELSQKYDQLARLVEQLRLGRGYASYLEREAEKFQRFQQFQQKSRQTARKMKEKPFQLEGIKVQNVKGEILKSGLLNDVNKMELNKQQIAKYELMHRKTTFNISSKQGKAGQSKQLKEFRDLRDNRDSKDYRDLKDVKDTGKDKDHYVNSLKDSKQSQGFKRSHSIRKLDKLDRRLKVDEAKDLNVVLRQIQLRIETKVSHDIFMGFVKDFQEKMEILKLSRDSSTQINELRKNFFVLQSKIQSIIAFLQSTSQEDEATFVKKQWTCISCDKGLEKYQGKVGQHLNWDTIASKKISPTKLGAFGQTGQLAAKIKNLMQGQQGQE